MGRHGVIWRLQCKGHKKAERQAVHMHYLPFGARLNKGILMVTQ